MYRLVEETKGEPKKVYGVPTDYDLSSWMDSLNPDYTKTSQQRTGIPRNEPPPSVQTRYRVSLLRHAAGAARHSIGISKGLTGRRSID